MQSMIKNEHGTTLQVPKMTEQENTDQEICSHIHDSTVDMRTSHEYVTDDHECRHAVAASSLLPMTPGSMAP